MSSKSQKDAVAHLTNNEKLLLRWRLARCSEISRSALNWGLSGPKFHSQHRPLETAGSVPEVHPSYTPCHLATKTRGDKQARVCPDTARLPVHLRVACSFSQDTGGRGRQSAAQKPQGPRAKHIHHLALDRRCAEPWSDSDACFRGHCDNLELIR